MLANNDLSASIIVFSNARSNRLVTLTESCLLASCYLSNSDKHALGLRVNVLLRRDV